MVIEKYIERINEAVKSLFASTPGIPTKLGGIIVGSAAKNGGGKLSGALAGGVNALFICNWLLLVTKHP